MALIDRGQVMKDYLENLGRMDSYKAKYEALVKAVDNAPTIDAEPVKHGEFTTLDEVNTFVTALPKRCETCGTEFIILFRKSEPNQGMFCPRCGARRRDE